MGRVESRWKSVAPSVAPVSSLDRDESQLGHFEKPVDAVSFGFVATAILIAMFLVMAIFERFFRPRSSGSGRRNLADHEAARGKLNYPSPKITTYASGVSVLMPGENTPTFIAHPAPAPVPCPAEGILRPMHQQNSTLSKPSSSSVTS